MTIVVTLGDSGPTIPALRAGMVVTGAVAPAHTTGALDPVHTTGAVEVRVS